jgi:hypothetical protein
MPIQYKREPFDVRRHILNSPFAAMTITDRTSRYSGKADKLLQHPCYHGREWYEEKEDNTAMKFASVYCSQHGRNELVPQFNYVQDLRLWYDHDRHPRFSAQKVLMELGFRFHERRIPDKGVIVDLMLSSKTEEEFREKVKPQTPVWFYHQRRRYRVTREFVDKFRKEKFTNKDFLDEPNQDLRRLMVRRGVELKTLLRSSMTKIAEDSEGSLWRDRTRHLRVNYLFVKCPSTGDEFLLGVPSHLRSPMTARRWTFGLGHDAVFMKET